MRYTNLSLPLNKFQQNNCYTQKSLLLSISHMDKYYKMSLLVRLNTFLQDMGCKLSLQWSNILQNIANMTKKTLRLTLGLLDRQYKCFLKKLDLLRTVQSRPLWKNYMM